MTNKEWLIQRNLDVIALSLALMKENYGTANRMARDLLEELNGVLRDEYGEEGLDLLQERGKERDVHSESGKN
jgi:hypothetical protein